MLLLQMLVHMQNISYTFINIHVLCIITLLFNDELNIGI